MKSTKYILLVILIILLFCFNIYNKENFEDDESKVITFEGDNITNRIEVSKKNLEKTLSKIFFVNKDELNYNKKLECRDSNLQLKYLLEKDEGNEEFVFDYEILYFESPEIEIQVSNSKNSTDEIDYFLNYSRFIQNIFGYMTIPFIKRNKLFDISEEKKLFIQRGLAENEIEDFYNVIMIEFSDCFKEENSYIGINYDLGLRLSGIYNTNFELISKNDDFINLKFKNKFYILINKKAIPNEKVLNSDRIKMNIDLLSYGFNISFYFILLLYIKLNNKTKKEYNRKLIFKLSNSISKNLYAKGDIDKLILGIIQFLHKKNILIKEFDKMLKDEVNKIFDEDLINKSITINSINILINLINKKKNEENMRKILQEPSMFLRDLINEEEFDKLQKFFETGEMEESKPIEIIPEKGELIPLDEEQVTDPTDSELIDKPTKGDEIAPEAEEIVINEGIKKKMEEVVISEIKDVSKDVSKDDVSIKKVGKNVSIKIKSIELDKVPSKKLVKIEKDIKNYYINYYKVKFNTILSPDKIEITFLPGSVIINVRILKETEEKILTQNEKDLLEYYNYIRVFQKGLTPITEYEYKKMLKFNIIKKYSKL